MDALPALTSDRQLLLLVAGGVFSLAGLWMKFRPAKEGDAAKLELFGLKFQPSSAGLLVFLIGAFLFVGGVILPEREAGAAGDGTQASGPAGTGEDEPGTTGGSTVVQATGPSAAALSTAQPRAVTFDGKEAGDNEMQVFDDLGGKINACWKSTCRLNIQNKRYFVQIGLTDRQDFGNKSFGYSLTIAAREE